MCFRGTFPPLVCTHVLIQNFLNLFILQSRFILPLLRNLQLQNHINDGMSFATATGQISKHKTLHPKLNGVQTRS